MINRKQISSFFASFTVHIAVLTALHILVTFPKDELDSIFAIDSTIDPTERQRIDFHKKLEENETPATTFNTVPGAVSTQVGGRSNAIQQRQKLEVESRVDTHTIRYRPADVTLPGRQTIGDDLGETEVHGSSQVLVRGYGPALDQLTQELIRLMRRNKLLVVWLFDESESMKDDQEQIKKRIGKVYQELQIVNREADKIGISKRIQQSRSKSKSLLDEILLTSVVSYGANYHKQTKTPTSDLSTIISAINRIPIDKTGKELTFAAISQAINQHKVFRARSKRKLVIVVVSDESGDDGQLVEPVIQQAKTFKAPVYILGREASFGSYFAYVNWRQPETGRIFRRPIRRGPESPYTELLQHDGFRRRRDSHMSGFGPYEQVRLCRDSGGIFFQLPHEQQNLNDYEAYEYAALAMQEYKPDLDSRAVYALKRDRSKFRRAIVKVIATLDPFKKGNQNLELPDPRYQVYTTNPSEMGPLVKKRGQQILHLLGLFQKAIDELEAVRDLRDLEPSRRWRANYDLIRAQLHWYQLRLYEYGIGMDQFIRLELKNRLTKNKKHNRWTIRESGRRLVLPDEVNQKRFKVTPEELKEMKKQAIERLEAVAQTHPGTPWATRAIRETKRPFGVTFGSFYRPPPKPNRNRPRKRPKPTPPPNL